ncbi:hypothetical protein Gorai_014942 [Gossypium raimondii]|uniref:Cationic amino acid transporter C-terminal domain-containing protein n=1 Tax=Gossypium raimondii TaxID=29730 RepID=A0A7J8P4L1_GOSRA|nr:hypothetical protein [Gossypium raimondii]
MASTMDDSRHKDATSSSTCFSHFCSSALRAKTLKSSSSANNSSDGLIRRLGVFDLILLGVGASIGAGIFVVTGTVARDAGPGVTISFILAGASCVLNALCYAELASRFPAIVGGAYLYAYTAFNEITAFLVFMQLMLDYHIGAASIARSLASYVATIFELIPALKGNIPPWVGHGGQEFFGGTLSINILAPILLAVLTVILCLGVGESSAVNSFMTAAKVVIVIFVIIVGSFKVDVDNWSPFAPNGVKHIFTGATVVFFAYVGFDAVANSAEESKRPQCLHVICSFILYIFPVLILIFQRDLPIGILGSLLVCVVLYVGVCLVITGMVPYNLLGEDAPLSEAFTSKGLKYVSILISIGAVAGLTTTLLVGLYVQSRLYLGLGRDGLLPSIFAKVHPIRHTPIHSQIWVGIVAAVLGGLFNVHILSHILSVGSLTGYSVVAACVVTLRWKNNTGNRVSSKCISTWCEGVLCIFLVACCGFAAGVLYRFGTHFIVMIVAVVIAIMACAALCFRQAYSDPPGFSCPWVPIVPSVCIFFNIFLFAQLHYEAWIRFIILSIVSVGIYAFYGQYHANPRSDETIIYHMAPEEDRH